MASFIILTGRKRMPGPLSRIIDFVMPALAREGRGGAGRGGGECAPERARARGEGGAVQVEGRRRYGRRGEPTAGGGMRAGGRGRGGASP